MNENSNELSSSNIKTLSGIDAFYYFAESNSNYELFFLDLLKQIEDKERYFMMLDYQYKDGEISVKINNIEFAYNGMGRDGFHWFSSEYVRLAFKDKDKNRTLHNIRVQFNAIGIYTIGLKSMIEYVNEKIINDITTGYYPITRVDLNSFVQHDFEYVREDMWVSKKQSYDEIIKTHGKIRKRETITIGKSPFKLRVYDKLAELTKSKKKELMLNYFGINGLDLEEPIFNVEFELHREFLKQYGIDTIEDVLKRSVTLFHHAMDAIRLIDINSITEKQLQTTNRNKALTLPIWEHIKQSYKLDDFLQIRTPLYKIESISYLVTLEDIQQKIEKLLIRLMIHGHSPTISYVTDCLIQARERYAIKVYFAKSEGDDITINEANQFDVFIAEAKRFTSEQLRARVSILGEKLERLELNGGDDYNIKSIKLEMEAFQIELTERGLAPNENDVF